MNKTTQLKILRGGSTKLGNLRTLIRTHYNNEGWDTEANREEAARLYNDLAGMMNLLRNETT